MNGLLKNEMTFGISKLLLLQKPINFVKTDKITKIHSFFIGRNKLHKTDNYTYLGIPFDESLHLNYCLIWIVLVFNDKVKFILSISY